MIFSDSSIETEKATQLEKRSSSFHKRSWSE